MLAELLARNARHVGGLPTGHFEDVLDAQRPRVAAMSCADSRVSVEGMWAVDEPGWLFTPQIIGNQVWDQVDGRLVVHGSLLYPVHVLDTRTVVVVGHTGCGAIQAALAAVREDRWPQPPGIRHRVELLVPVVEEGLEEHGHEEPGLVDRLVEHNVHRQVAFLLGSGELPDDTDVHGFVYDLHGSYGGPRGRASLVNSNGERDPKALRELVPAEHATHVASLLR